MVRGAWARMALDNLLKKYEMDSRGEALQRLSEKQRDKNVETRREKKRVRKHKRAESRRRKPNNKKKRR